MSDEEILYCKIFVEGSLSRDDLTALLCNGLHGVATGNTIIASHLEIDVIDNDDFVARSKRRDPNDFVHFPYFLDVEPATGAERLGYVARVGDTLKVLERGGLQAVAACSFEDELPSSGRVP
jgi:hypothetical protein